MSDRVCKASAYQDLYRNAHEVIDLLASSDDIDGIRDATRRLLLTFYIPQLLRHIQILNDGPSLMSGVFAKIRHRTDGSASTEHRHGGDSPRDTGSAPPIETLIFHFPVRIASVSALFLWTSIGPARRGKQTPLSLRFSASLMTPCGFTAAYYSSLPAEFGCCRYAGLQCYSEIQVVLCCSAAVLRSEGSRGEGRGKRQEEGVDSKQYAVGRFKGKVCL